MVLAIKGFVFLSHLTLETVLWDLSFSWKAGW